jgi:hypothetical protein
MKVSDHKALAQNPQSIPFEEWWRLWHFVTSFDVRDTGPMGVWLEVAHGSRTWHIASSRFRFEYREDAADAHGSFRVPMTVRAISAATDIATTSTPTTLSLADDSSIMLACDDATVVLDVPPFRPGETFVVDDVDCSAEVPAKRLADVLDVARTPPAGVEITGNGPPLWCVIGDGKIAFHSDWTMYGHGRSTVSLNATTIGEASFHTAVSLVSRVLRDFTNFDDEDSVIEFAVDRPDGRGCRVTGPGWVLTCPFIDPVGVEFGTSMRRELMMADIDFVRDGERAVEFNLGGARVRAHVHGGANPICRLSATVARGIDCSEFLLAELNEWNKSHAGMKFWWENSKVVAVVDLDCAHMSDIVPETARLAAVAENLSPATSAL